MVVRSQRVMTLAVAVAALGWLAACGGGSGGGPFQSAAPGDLPADRIALTEGGVGQFTIPVQVGTQTFNLLLDTGFNGLLVFNDLITAENVAIQRTGEQGSIEFGSGTRSGELATAPIKVGNRTAAEVRILLVTSPTSTTDPSLTWKRAQGILGMRFQPCMVEYYGTNLDPPLLKLDPKVRALEFDLRSGQPSSLVIGGTPTLTAANQDYVFTAQTTTETREDRIRENYADLEVPFKIASSAGTAADDDLDILLDTGAASLLVLDVEVAQRIGYDAGTRSWRIGDSEELSLDVIGLAGTLAISPKFKVGDVRVIDLAGTTFDAVLGLNRWQDYVIAFDFTDFSLGGPEGTFRFLARSDQPAATQPTPAFSDRFIALPGLNSSAEETAPSISANGSRIVFGSDRRGGLGLRDIYCYDRGQSSLVAIGPLNSSSNDEDPACNEDGTLVVFTSDRPGGAGDFDIYLWDVTNQQFIDLPGLNSDSVERSPYLSPDGRYISFRTERYGSATPSDVYLYDRNTGAFVDLPGLNGDSDDFTSALSRGATKMIIEALNRDGDRGGVDVHVYDVTDTREIALSSEVNSTAYDAFVGMSGDGRYITYFSDRNAKTPGAAGRDIFLADLNQNGADGSPGKLVDLAGLNSSLEESDASLNEDGSLITFVSARAGGSGGLDVYLYRQP